VSESQEISGSVEMYLATIAVLREGDQPVPLSALAEYLTHSPVSVNEMCRKLAERDMVSYQPYKGVTLTPAGESLARHVLCRRQLWEVFLVERLGIDLADAEAMACSLEHATADELAERMADYLGHPAFCPHNEPIPDTEWQEVTYKPHPLSELPIGGRARVSSIGADAGVQNFLESQGLAPPAVVKVMAGAVDGPLLVSVSGRFLSLSRNLSELVQVVPLPEKENQETSPELRSEYIKPLN
jgi:DtxR family Mn-dependent transcriptional regulator